MINGGLQPGDPQEHFQSRHPVHVDDNVREFIDRRCQSMRSNPTRAPWISANGSLPNRRPNGSLRVNLPPKDNYAPPPRMLEPLPLPSQEISRFSTPIPPFHPNSEQSRFDRTWDTLSTDVHRHQHGPSSRNPSDFTISTTRSSTFYRRQKHAAPENPPEKLKKSAFRRTIRWVQKKIFRIDDNLEKKKDQRFSRSKSLSLKKTKFTSPRPPNGVSSFDHNPQIPQVSSSSHKQHVSLPLLRSNSADNIEDYRLMPLQKGIPNLGNSCYWNASIQCLAAVEPLASYMIENFFRKRIIVDQEESLNYVFALLLEAMWRNQDERVVEHIRRMRVLMDKLNLQFTQTQQQDAHEFIMAFCSLLGKEQNFNVNRRPDDRRPTEDNIFSRIFGADMREARRCVTCGTVTSQSYKQNFIHLSLPSDETCLVQFSQVNAIGKSDPVVSRSLLTSLRSGVNGVAYSMAHECDFSPENTLIFQMTKYGFSDCLVTENDLTFHCGIRKNINRRDGDDLYCAELRNPPLGADGHEVVNAVFVHATKHHNRIERFSEPILATISVAMSYVDIATVILKSSRELIAIPTRSDIRGIMKHISIFMQIDCSMRPGLYQLDAKEKLPLVALNVYSILDDQQQCIAPCKARFIRLVVEWKTPVPYWVKMHHQMRRPKSESSFNHHGKSSYSLKTEPYQVDKSVYDVVNMIARYVSPEFVSDWKCEQCNQYGCVRETVFTELPWVICVMIKRFMNEENGGVRKLDTPVTFDPVRVNYGRFIAGSDNNDWTYYHYDVIGVLCHYGTMGSGHYIAYTRHPMGDTWKRYDDSTVSSVTAAEVDRKNAYLLFLQRSNTRGQTRWAERERAEESRVAKGERLNPFPVMNATTESINSSRRSTLPPQAPFQRAYANQNGAINGHRGTLPDINKKPAIPPRSQSRQQDRPQHRKETDL